MPDYCEGKIDNQVVNKTSPKTDKVLFRNREESNFLPLDPQSDGM